MIGRANSARTAAAALCLMPDSTSGEARVSFGEATGGKPDATPYGRCACYYFALAQYSSEFAAAGEFNDEDAREMRAAVKSNVDAAMLFRFAAGEAPSQAEHSVLVAATEYSKLYLQRFSENVEKFDVPLEDGQLDGDDLICHAFTEILRS